MTPEEIEAQKRLNESPLELLLKENALNKYDRPGASKRIATRSEGDSSEGDNSTTR